MADELLAEMSARRIELAARLQAHGVGPDRLSAGDGRLAALRAVWATPGDWKTRLDELKAILALWRSADRTATVAWLEEEEHRSALRELARAAERRHQQSFEWHMTASAYRSTNDERSWL
jgi:hypothetical protein